MPRKSKGPEMKPEQFKDALAQLDQTIIGCTTKIGISRRQAQRFASGESPVSKPVARLLRILIKHGISLDECVP